MLLRPVLMPILRNPLQGIADGIRNMLAELLGSSQFFAPLTHSLVLARGTGSPTFTRASTATFTDWEGVLRTVPSGCARFEGARIVQNLWTTSSATLANGANKSLTLATGDYTFSMGAGTGTATFSGTGGATGTLAASASGRVEVTKTITAGTFVVTASVADLVDLQVEYVTGQADQTASEYVSVGVLSAPYHGSFVDGVKCFNTDLAGNALPTSYTYDAVSLNGVAGTYVSTPDSVAASITGDIDIRVKVAPVSWSGGYCYASKWDSSGTKSTFVFIGVAGKGLRLFHTADGTTVRTDTATAGVSFADGATGWVRVTRVAATGVVTFYESADGITWTQVGAPVAGVAEALQDNNAPVEFGSYSSGGAANLSGNVYEAQIYNGIDGTLAVDFDASRYEGGTTLTGSTGETWTLQGNAVIHPTNSPNTGYLAETADVLAYPTASNILAAASTVYLEFTPDHTPSGTIALWGTYVDASNYTAILHDATNMIMRKRIAGVNYDATIANAFTANTTYKVCGSWGASGVTVTLDGTEGTASANTTAAQIAATMQWGADGNSLQQPFATERNARVWQRQLSTSERGAITA